MEEETGFKIKIIIPSFNEEKNIIKLVDSLNVTTNKINNIKFDYLFIDDGSTDNTFNIIKKLSIKDKKIQCLRFSRNFGAHNSITAGIDKSIGYDAVINISGDMQEPSNLIIKMIDSWKNGNNVVWTIRKKRAQNLLNKFFSGFFYFLFNKLSILKNYPKGGPSALFLIDKKIIQNWNKFQESNRLVLGIISWMGFKQDIIEYEQLERKGGKSSYNFFKLLDIAIDFFVSFSFLPIRFISFIGIIVSTIGFAYAIFLIFNKIFYNIQLEGWTSIMVVILVMGGVQLTTLGIIGEYIWRGVSETRKRPLYLISEKINID